MPWRLSRVRIAFPAGKGALGQVFNQDASAHSVCHPCIQWTNVSWDGEGWFLKSSIVWSSGGGGRTKQLLKGGWWGGGGNISCPASSRRAE